MKLLIAGTTRNYIFAGLLCLSVLALIISYSIGERQDKMYRNNYKHYQQAVKLVKENNYKQANIIINQLDENSRTTYQVLYLQALCEEDRGELAGAASLMQQVREVRPVMVRDQTYLFDYGRILFQQGLYERAKLYLQESLKYRRDAAITNEANSYLEQIDKITQGGR